MWCNYWAILLNALVNMRLFGQIKSWTVARVHHHFCGPLWACQNCIFNKELDNVPSSRHVQQGKSFKYHERAGLFK
jgi:hypothetical protein